jgi:hypothetical protein
LLEQQARFEQGVEHLGVQRVREKPAAVLIGSG